MDYWVWKTFDGRYLKEPLKGTIFSESRAEARRFDSWEQAVAQCPVTIGRPVRIKVKAPDLIFRIVEMPEASRLEIWLGKKLMRSAVVATGGYADDPGNAFHLGDTTISFPVLRIERRV